MPDLRPISVAAEQLVEAIIAEIARKAAAELRPLITAPKVEQPAIAPRPLLVTKAEAARLLSVSPRTIFEMRRRGELRAVMVCGAPRYSVAELQDWIARQIAAQSSPDSNSSGCLCGKEPETA